MLDKLVAHSVEVKLVLFCLVNFPDWKKTLYFHVLALSLEFENPIRPDLNIIIGVSFRTEFSWEELREKEPFLGSISDSTSIKPSLTHCISWPIAATEY